MELTTSMEEPFDKQIARLFANIERGNTAHGLAFVRMLDLADNPDLALVSPEELLEVLLKLHEYESITKEQTRAISTWGAECLENLPAPDRVEPALLRHEAAIFASLAVEAHIIEHQLSGPDLGSLRIVPVELYGSDNG